MSEEHIIRLSQNEIDNLMKVSRDNTDTNIFDISTKGTGIGDVVEVTIKVSDKEKRVIDITDYDNW